MSFSARGCSIRGMSRQEIEQKFAEMEAQIEEFREMVNNAEFWIQKLELNPEIVALRKAVQEKDREIAKIKEIYSAYIRSLCNSMDKSNEDIRDLQDFKSKFMDFKSRCSCSQFRDFWPWE